MKTFEKSTNNFFLRVEWFLYMNNDLALTHSGEMVMATIVILESTTCTFASLFVQTLWSLHKVKRI